MARSGRTFRVAGVLVLLAGAVGLGWIAGMRDKGSLIVGAQRRVNKAVFNPRQLRSAGQPGAFAALLQHTGRTTGKGYQTPVGAVVTDDGFAIALMYGRQTDWLRNVLAGGSATVVHEGTAFEVGQPEIVPVAAAARFFDEGDQRSMRLFGVADVLLLHRTGPQPESNLG